MLLTGGADAWEIETSVSYGCHEHWAAEALDEVGRIGDPPPLEGSMRHLRSSLDWDASWVADDLFALSLTAGAHSNDVGATGSIDIGRLVALHNDPLDQDAHCLRAAWEDGEEGDASAVASCRAWIEGEVMEALAASGPDGLPDPLATEMAQMNLAYTGKTGVPVSTFYFHMGRAMHALEDSFSHSYRSGDRHGIVEVQNWIEDVSGSLSKDRDGPPHLSAADDCLCDREWAQPTYDAAYAAGRDLLAAASLPEPVDVREAAVSAVLDTWLTHVPGCDAGNGYCGSPDPVDLAGDPCSGCTLSSHPTAGRPAAGWAAVAFALALLSLRQRRRE